MGGCIVKLVELINVAENKKPPWMKPCNNCGWCCLTEVCSIGVEITGSTQIPCSLLVSKGDEHHCGVAMEGDTEIIKRLAIGRGCDAKTQKEVIKDLGF